MDASDNVLASVRASAETVSVMERGVVLHRMPDPFPNGESLGTLIFAKD